LLVTEYGGMIRVIAVLLAVLMSGIAVCTNVGFVSIEQPAWAAAGY
jgi:hypothetical protein